MQRRSSSLTVATFPSLPSLSGDVFSDSRFHGYQGPTRNVRFPRATASGGGTVARSEDGVRCVVAGRESLRVLRLSNPDDASTDHKSVVGPGGHRVELSKNLWDGSGLKIESVSTDVAWCNGNYNNKVLTSARNGDLVMWDLEKPGSTKYERKTKNHIRSIHKLSCSSIVPYYCITGSADGDMRIWDLRDMSRSVMKIHHPTSVRSLVFSPTVSHPLQAVVGLDNGSIYRWDLQMGQRGQLDRLPVAHTGSILALDWCSTSVASKGTDNVQTQMERSWIVSGGLDHTVKVWDLPGSSTSSHIVNKPTYVLHPSYPVRRVLCRPEFPCELALVSNAEFGGGGGAELMSSPRAQNTTPSFISSLMAASEPKDAEDKPGLAGETVEIWDVRRGWIAKWTVDTCVADGGVTDAVFRDSYALLVQHASGTFAQVDLRHSHRPIDAIPRVALSWNAVDGSDGALAFVADKRGRWEVPYDDIHPDRRSLVADRRVRIKALGDKTRIPGLQNMGMYVRAPPSADMASDAFVRLAKGYVVPDKSHKKDACAVNARVAIQAGNVHAAQAWISLGSLLTDVVPESVIASLPVPGKVEPPYPLVHSASAPGAIPTTESVTVHNTGPASKPPSFRALSADSGMQSTGSPHSPSQSRIGQHQHHVPTSRSVSVNGAVPNEDHKHVRHRRETQLPLPTKPPPNSRNLTPASSASSSPRHVPVALPITSTLPLPPTATMTPTTATAQRRPSILVSTASLVHGHARRPSVFNRGVSAPSESPSVTSASDKSLRHVGEGALDDSDSSGEESAAESQSHASEAEHVEKPLAPAMPRVGKARSLSGGRAGAGPAHPSPLSRLAGQQQWVDEEEVEGLVVDAELGSGSGSGTSTCKRHVDEDEASPSPVSTDTDDERSDDSEEVPLRAAAGVSRSRSRKNRNSVRRVKSRSRSSTVASLAAPGPMLSPARSSPSRPPTGSCSPTPVQGVLERMGSQSSVETVIAASVRENEGAVVDSGKDLGEYEPASWMEMSHQRKVVVVEEERQVQEAGWRALREALEEYAEEGDVQMCAMLALVAPEELKVDMDRMIRFVEAYIDMLVRYRLHACAAYLRKYSPVEEVQKVTRLETVVYTACRRCRKPVVGMRSRNPHVKATHAVCAACKKAVTRCSICHLPVWTLLFQCSVCSHGGHQECYRRYYMERPMVELPTQLSARGRQLQRVHDGDNGGEEGRNAKEKKARERPMAGHPCAAGCGHICWAAVGRRGQEKEQS